MNYVFLNYVIIYHILFIESHKILGKASFVSCILLKHNPYIPFSINLHHFIYSHIAMYIKTSQCTQPNQPSRRHMMDIQDHNAGHLLKSTFCHIFYNWLRNNTSILQYQKNLHSYMRSRLFSHPSISYLSLDARNLLIIT